MAMPARLTEVGAHERPDHTHLPADARCFFWGEYTPYEHTNGKKWNFSETNQLVSNFKKKMDRAGQYDWRYKQEAIQQIGQKFATTFKWADLQSSHRPALVPMPPSKRRNDPMFDPRMLDVLKCIAVRTKLQLDIRDCLSFSGKYGASHESDNRPTPDELYAELSFHGASSTPGVIFLFDDMLTTGAHFRAAARVLAAQYPGVPVIGNFVARRCAPNPFDDLDAL
jgi:predicted amidophosphoribosyltransferase